jgi:crotonobetainyl-CoA:carnitine CoA-transferase CaiB-like acyl-CoA transferase
MTDGLLSGYRALDLTDEKGFICGQILASIGIDVIKIERPGGDPARNTPPLSIRTLRIQKGVFTGMALIPGSEE